VLRCRLALVPPLNWETLQNPRAMEKRQIYLFTYDNHLMAHQKQPPAKTVISTLTKVGPDKADNAIAAQIKPFVR
jgi:hypothetical protein